MMELKSATQDQEHALTLALAHLRRARALLVKANCTSSLKKLRSTIKSAEGAERHMSRRRSATKEAMLEEGRRAVAEEVAAAGKVSLAAPERLFDMPDLGLAA